MKTYDRAFALTNAIADTERTFHDKKDDLHNSKIFTELETMVTKTNFKEHAETVYLSRFAAALGVDKKDGAFDYAQSSLLRIDLSRPSRGNTNVIYAFINLLLQKYASTKNNDTKIQLRGWIETGFQQICEEKSHIKRLWNRMLSVKMAFVLLGLDNSSEVIKGIPDPSEEEITKAQKCLEELKHDQALDRRRKMLCCIADARIAELMHDAVTRNKKLEDAFSLSESTFCGEERTLRKDRVAHQPEEDIR